MLSVPHLIVIFLVALVVFGPHKLPELARNLGKIMGEFRRATSDLRGTFEEHMRELEREAQVIDQKKRDLDRQQAEINSAIHAASATQASAAAQPTPDQPPALPAPIDTSLGGAMTATIGTNNTIASNTIASPHEILPAAPLTESAPPVPGTVPTQRPTEVAASEAEKNASTPAQDDVHVS